MRVSDLPPLHLTYSMNVHPGESANQLRSAILEHAVAVKQRVAPDRAFGLGLRVSAQAVEEILQTGMLADLRAILAEHDLYVFTINGFPYGRFHGDRVKERVYSPDWATQERVAYTRRLAQLLAALCPEDEGGSISTVPGSFGAWVTDDEYVEAMMANLAVVACDLERLSREHGVDLHLGLEPEPSCWLDTGADFLRAYHDHLLVDGARAVAARLGVGGAEAETVVRRRIGLCLDTCHASVGFEDPCALWDRCLAAGIRISKVQLSAAVVCDLSKGAETSRAALAPFLDHVYLHQSRARTLGGDIVPWLDLPDALADLPKRSDLDELRTHFHVPLFWRGEGVLGSTADELSPAFFDRLRAGSSAHLEIETYTYDVLPSALKSESLVASIAREYQWTLENLRLQP